MFAVMLAFVILFSLQSYQRAHTGASVEAVAVGEMRPSQTFSDPTTSDRLRGGLVCYGRAVINDEWPAMQKGRSSELVESWIGSMHRDFARPTLEDARQQEAYAQWFDEVAQRRDGRRERLAESSPLLPLPLWLALAIGASLTLAYMVAQADRREGVVIQAIPIAFVAALVTAGLLVVLFLDNPYSGGNGSIRPTEMTRTLDAHRQRRRRALRRARQPYLAVASRAWVTLRRHRNLLRDEVRGLVCQTVGRIEVVRVAVAAAR